MTTFTSLRSSKSQSPCRYRGCSSRHIFYIFLHIQIYKFPDGFPMGGPLSSLVADIFMDDLETRFLSSEPLSPHIRHWSRYVDDVLCVWHGSRTDLKLCLDRLNTICPSLQFTLEIGGQQINFLDLTISLKEYQNVLSPSFNIFRKSTFTGVAIHSSSLHPRAHKAAAVTSAIHRMVSIPLDADARKEETSTIKKIASLNNLNVDIDLMIRRISAHTLLRENRVPPPTNNTKERWLRLPYMGAASDKLASLLRRYGYRVGFYPVSTVGDLVRLKDRSTPLDQSGIYQLSCGMCPAVYIGQTGRKLSTRLSEHRTALKPTSTKKSAFAAHCRSKRHDFNKLEVSLLHACPKGRLMNRLEETETIAAAISRKEHLLNDLSATFVNPFIRYYLGYAPHNTDDNVNIPFPT